MVGVDYSSLQLKLD